MSGGFSNGTEGRAWMALWCDRCEVDHGMHTDEQDNGCIHVVTSMCGDFPEAWTDESERFGFTFPPAIRCSEFKACGSCGLDIPLDANGYPAQPARQQEFIAAVNGQKIDPIQILDQVLQAPGSAS